VIQSGRLQALCAFEVAPLAAKLRAKLRLGLEKPTLNLGVLRKMMVRT